MFINNVAAEFMADAGSNVNIINLSTLNQLKINRQQLKTADPIFAYG